MAGGLDSRPDVGDFLTQAWFSPPSPPPSSPHGGYEQGPDAGDGHEPASERERLIFELINVLRWAKEAALLRVVVGEATTPPFAPLLTGAV